MYNASLKMQTTFQHHEAACFRSEVTGEYAVWVCVVISAKQKAGAHLIPGQATLGQRGHCVQAVVSAVLFPD